MERKQIEIYKIKFDEIIQELDGVELAMNNGEILN